MSSVLKAALLISLALITACGQRTISQPSRLSDEEARRLELAFQRLESTLEDKAPKIHAQFRRGTVEEELDHLRSCLSGNQVEVLEKWFSWHNGASENLLPNGIPISVERAVEDQRIKESIPFVPDVRRNSVKILDDNAGDGYFVSVNTEKPLVFHHMLEDPGNPIWFGTLSDFLNFISDGFENGILFQTEDGKFDYDEAAFEELMADYLADTNRWN